MQTKVGRWTEARRAVELTRYETGIDFSTNVGLELGDYVAGVAHSERLVNEALQLRFDVFNRELGEGLAHSWETGLDRDPFDSVMTHLVVLHRPSGQVVGTYRVRSCALSPQGRGLYTQQEFDLGALGPLLEASAELGRACIDRDHRTLVPVRLLWRAIEVFLREHHLRYTLGCCSLTSQDPAAGWGALDTAQSLGRVHPTLRVPVQDAFRCPTVDGLPNHTLPKLFRTYLRLGAWVVSEPALDRHFGTVDFLILLDTLADARGPAQILQGAVAT